MQAPSVNSIFNIERLLTLFQHHESQRGALYRRIHENARAANRAIDNDFRRLLESPGSTIETSSLGEDDAGMAEDEDDEDEMAETIEQFSNLRVNRAIHSHNRSTLESRVEGTYCK